MIMIILMTLMIMFGCCQLHIPISILGNSGSSGRTFYIDSNIIIIIIIIFTDPTTKKNREQNDSVCFIWPSIDIYRLPKERESKRKNNRTQKHPRKHHISHRFIHCRLGQNKAEKKLRMIMECMSGLCMYVRL